MHHDIFSGSGCFVHIGLDYLKAETCSNLDIKNRLARDYDITVRIYLVYENMAIERTSESEWPIGIDSIGSVGFYPAVQGIISGNFLR